MTTFGMTSDGDPPMEGAPPTERVATTLPADPAQYDSDRGRIARAKGLPAGYIAGGKDPDPEAGLREERYYGRLLLAMVITIVFAGFVLGILIMVATGSPPP